MLEIVFIGLLIQEYFHTPAVKCKDAHHVGSIQLKKRFVKHGSVRLVFKEILDVSLSSAIVYGLYKDQLPESDKVYFYFQNHIVKSLLLSTNLFHVLILNLNNCRVSFHVERNAIVRVYLQEIDEF